MNSWRMLGEKPNESPNGVEDQRRDEQRRRVAAQRGRAKRALQADEGVAGPEGIAVEAAGGAEVGTQEMLDLEARLEPATEVLAALEADEAGGHVAAVGLPDLGRSGGLEAAGRHVHQAVERNGRLGLGGAGQAEAEREGRGARIGTGHDFSPR